MLIVTVYTVVEVEEEIIRVGPLFFQKKLEIGVMCQKFHPLDACGVVMRENLIVILKMHSLWDTKSDTSSY